MAKKTIADIDKEVALVSQGLVDHETACLLAYRNVNDSISTLTSSIKEIRNWLIGVAAGVICILLSMIAFLGTKYLDNLDKQYEKGKAAAMSKTFHDNLLADQEN